MLRQDKLGCALHYQNLAESGISTDIISHLAFFPFLSCFTHTLTGFSSIKHLNENICIQLLTLGSFCVRIRSETTKYHNFLAFI